MNSLEQFLALPNVDNVVEEINVSERLTKAFGKFKVKAMTQDDFRNYQRLAQGKIGKKGFDFDISKFNLSMVAGQTIEPDFSNKELLASCGCALPEQLVTKKLLAGEIAELSKQIQIISGFDTDTEEDLEEAKN